MMLARKSAAAAVAARLATRPLLGVGSRSSRGRPCAGSATAAVGANGGALRARALVPGRAGYLARSAVTCNHRRLEHFLPQPLSTLVDARGEEGGGRGDEPPKSARLEGGRWDWTGVVAGEGGQDCGEKKRQEARGIAALATLTSPRRMMSKPRYKSPPRKRRGGGGGNQERHSPASGGPSNTSGNGIVTATNAIIAINLAAYVMQEQDPSITRSYYNLAYSITEQGEWFRLVTAMALHGGWAHLFCNNMSLFNIGPTMERILGTTRFVAIYACSGVAGNMLSCIVHPLTPSLGASGAIFGVLGAETMLLLVGPHRSLKGFFESITRTAFFALIVALLVPNIDHMGHLGGFLGGAVGTLLLRPRAARS